MKLPSLLLFDLDGTLVDTAPEMHSALNILLKEQGMNSVEYNDVRPVSYTHLTLPTTPYV